MNAESMDDEGTEPCRVSIRNLGGIEQRELELPPGVSMLVGRNATNRSSFLQSVAAVLGGKATAVHPKSDADSGSVQLEIGDETYDRTIERSSGGVRMHGSPYGDDADVVDTFVALFPDSSVRDAVWHGEDLRDILMKPVDADAIRDRITELNQRQEQLESTIDRIEQERTELPRYEEEKQTLEAELEDVTAEIESLEETVAELRQDSVDTESDEAAELGDELEELRDRLNEAKCRVDETESKLDHRYTQRDQLETERVELEAELAAFDEAADLEAEITELSQEIERLESRRNSLQRAIEDLQSVIQANETLLDGDRSTIGFDTDSDVTASLDPEARTIECWTCGSEVAESQITDRIDSLRELVTDQRRDLTEIDDELSDRRSERHTCEETLDSYRENEHRLEELADRIEQHKRNIVELEADLEDHESDVARLEDEIATAETQLKAMDADEDDGTDEFITAHQELTDLQRERGRLETRLEDVTGEIERIESLAEKRSEAETELDGVNAELEELRGRIDTLERELFEMLNGVMEDMIDLLEYENIARVWVERQRSETDNESSFSLHIVREAADGSVYEDSVQTLSESERAVIGLVVSLVGYIVHDVDEAVPFLLVDSVEMIDGNRLARLLEYIIAETNVCYLVVALLPKDAQAVEKTVALESVRKIYFEITEPES